MFGNIKVNRQYITNENLDLIVKNREKLIQSGFGSGNQVNWSKLIKGEKGDIASVRQYLQDIVKGQLSEYDDVQVEKVLDAIVYKYDQAVSEKRKEIADKYIDAQLSGKRSTKKNSRCKN